MKKPHFFLTFLLVSAAVLVQGCLIAAVGAGAGTVAYLRGDLQAVEAKDINTVYAAAKNAVKQLDLTVTKDNKDAMSAVVIARDAEDKKITITLNAATEDTTKISIRVGIFGSETKSRRIYDQIKENLR
jgi:alpha-L-arabinofuranosidase